MPEASSGTAAMLVPTNLRYAVGRGRANRPPPGPGGRRQRASARTRGGRACRDRVVHALSIRIPLDPAGARPDPPRADAALWAGAGLGAWPVPAHLVERSAEGPAEDPQGYPNHARPRAGDNRGKPDGAAGGVFH